MANESKTYFTKKAEEHKLVNCYKEILEGKLNSSSDSQKKFLLQLLNTKITQLEPKTDSIKVMHYVLRVSVMILSGISTVILGLKLTGESWLSQNSSNIALVITAIVTFLSGLAVFWDTENYWKRNKIMLNKLIELRYEYVFFLEGGDAAAGDEIKKYLDKF